MNYDGFGQMKEDSNPGFLGRSSLLKSGDHQQMKVLSLIMNLISVNPGDGQAKD
jgi:hypothetical protein